MMKWALVLTAALLVPSVAHARDDEELGTCYYDPECTMVSEIEVTFRQCVEDGGMCWTQDEPEHTSIRLD